MVWSYGICGTYVFAEVNRILNNLADSFPLVCFDVFEIAQRFVIRWEILIYKLRLAALNLAKGVIFWFIDLDDWCL